jgi:SAM-dependent methyltransferase
MREELYEEMFRMEQEHWWFVAKHRIVLHLLRKFVRPPAGGGKARVADLGCGCGMMLRRLIDRCGAEYDAVGMEGAPAAVEFCRQRGVRVEVGELPSNVTMEAGAFDAVLLLDVLEHLDDDAGAVGAAARLLKRGGVMIVTVPAYQWLWSPRDEHHQHRRRYSKAAFAALFARDGLRIEMLSHYNTWLFPAAVAGRVATWARRPSDTTDLKVPVRPVNALLREIFASERGVLGRVPMPFGLSLLAVVRRT